MLFYNFVISYDRNYLRQPDNFQRNKTKKDYRYCFFCALQFTFPHLFLVFIISFIAFLLSLIISFAIPNKELSNIIRLSVCLALFFVSFISFYIIIFTYIKIRVMIGSMFKKKNIITIEFTKNGNEYSILNVETKKKITFRSEDIKRIKCYKTIIILDIKNMGMLIVAKSSYTCDFFFNNLK